MGKEGTKNTGNGNAGWIDRITNLPNAVKAYVIERDSEAAQVLVFEGTAGNIANFIGGRPGCSRIVVTDFLDALVMDTCGWFIDRCPDKKLLEEVKHYLIPIQSGEAEAKPVPACPPEALGDRDEGPAECADDVLEFPKDEVKVKVKWDKGYDFMDNSPRYTFEGRDPSNTCERFQVVIYAEREREFEHDPSSRRNFYYGYVRDNDKECADTIGRFKTLNKAKSETLGLFNEYMRKFADADAA